MYDLNNYQSDTAKTAIYPDQGKMLGLYYTALGLGESGEVQGKIKKIIRDNNGVVTEEKRQQLAGEIGDLLWYLSQTCTELGLDLSEVAQQNIDKLASRKERGVISGDGDNR